MAKITLNTILSQYGNVSLYNSNNAEIIDHLNNKVLYRDNPSGEANQMENNLDMNTNRIFNLPSPVNNTEAARWVDVATAIGLDTAVPSQTNNEGRNIETTGSTMVWGVPTDVVCQTVSDMTNANGLVTVGGRTIRSATIAEMADTGALITTTWNNTTSKEGGATYEIKTRAQHRTDIGDGVWVPDGYCDHYLLNGTTYVAVLQVNGAINIKQCGAMGDGSTVDILAIQAAIDYIDSFIGGDLYFPAGEYVIDAQIDIKEDVTLIGEGQPKFGTTLATNEVTAIVADTGYTGIMVKAGTASQGVRCSFKNIVIDGKGTASHGIDIDARTASPSWRMVLDHVKILGCGIGLRGRAGCWSLLAYDLQVIQCTTGIECIDECNAWTFHSLEINACTTGLAWGTAASTILSQSCSLFGGTIQGCVDGIKTNNNLARTLNLYGVYIEGNTGTAIDMNTGQISIYGGGIDAGSTYAIDVAAGFLHVDNVEFSNTPVTSCINFAATSGAFLNVPRNSTGKPLYTYTGSKPPANIYVKQNQIVDESAHRHNFYLDQADSTIRVFNNSGTERVEIDTNGIKTAGYIGVGNTASNTNAIPANSSRSWPIFDGDGALVGYVPVFASNW